MNSRSFPFPFFHLSLPFMLLILVNSAASSANDEFEWFLNCKDSLKCEIISTMPIPLWRNNGTGNCGYPETMKLNCDGSHAYATIEILGAKYEFLGLSSKDQILIIAEIGFSGRFCSSDQNISSSSIYAIILVDCEHPQIPNKPTCSVTKLGYMPFEYIPANADAYCMLSAVVPISPSLLKELDGLQKVAEHIKAEFDSEPKVDAQVCRNCSVSGGVCGYSNQTRCYCQSPSNGFEICLPGKKKKSNKTSSLVIGVSVGGASLVAIILGCCIFYCLRRKKKRPIESISKEGPSPSVSDPLSSKDMPPAPLLNSSQSHSIPSYPSSKSDLERGGSNHNIQVFSYAELEKATDNFNRSRELGDGGFGTVYYGKLHDGREVAVKRLYEHSCKRVEQFMNEVDILAHLQHQNLVKLYGCTSRYSQGLLLVYEYIPNGTVADHLHGTRAKFGLLSWPIRLRIAIETANALAYLHCSDIVHRDVKTNNILLDNNFTVKVADFGLSRLFPTDVTHVSTAPQGTPGYVDPEYYQCYQLTTKSDVYSFGVVLVELISSLQAVDTNRKRQDINLSNMAVSKVQSRALNELVDPKLGFDKNHEVMRMTTSVAELAFRCLQQERDMRPSMEEVVEVLREIENDKSITGKAEVVEIGVVEDEVELMKSTPPSFSPNSVIADNWVSSSTTTNSL